MSLLIRQARVLDTQQNLDKVLDVYIAEGKIAAMGDQLSQTAEHTLNAEGKILVPGMTDLPPPLNDALPSEPLEWR